MYWDKTVEDKVDRSHPSKSISCRFQGWNCGLSLEMPSTVRVFASRVKEASMSFERPYPRIIGSCDFHVRKLSRSSLVDTGMEMWTIDSGGLEGSDGGSERNVEEVVSAMAESRNQERGKTQLIPYRFRWIEWIAFVPLVSKWYITSFYIDALRMHLPY